MASTGRIREAERLATPTSRPVGLIGAPSDVAAGTRGATDGPGSVAGGRIALGPRTSPWS